MSRPLKKSYFGDTANPGSQIVVAGIKWADGTTSTNGFIIAQKGFNGYIVSNGVKQELSFLVNALSVGALAKGQCFILATPFGGVASPCYKIQQQRLSVYHLDGSISSYAWSSAAASNASQATLSEA